MDVTTILFMVTCKFAAFGFNVSDGYKPDSALSEYQRKTCIRKIPGFFPYFSYIYFFGSSLCGPFFEYQEFDQFINQYSSKDAKRHPHSALVTLKNLSHFFIFIISYSILNITFTTEYVLQDQFGAKNIVYKIFYIYMAALAQRLKYYSGTTNLPQSSIFASGPSPSRGTETELSASPPRTCMRTHFRTHIFAHTLAHTFMYTYTRTRTRPHTRARSTTHQIWRRRYVLSSAGILPFSYWRISIPARIGTPCYFHFRHPSADLPHHKSNFLLSLLASVRQHNIHGTDL